MKSPFSTGYVVPGIYINKGGAMGTSFNPIICNYINTCAKRICCNASISSGCVHDSFGVTPSFYASKFCNANGLMNNSTISAPTGFSQFLNTNWPSCVAPKPWLAGKQLIDESGILFSRKIVAEYNAY